MPRASLRSLLPLALGVTLGCSAGGGSTQAPPDLAPALGAVCDFLNRCPDLPPIAARDRNECIDVVYWALTCRLVETGGSISGVERTMLDLSSEEAAACEAFLSGIDCDGLSCVREGTCPEGAACLGLFPIPDDGDDGGDVAGPGERCYRFGTPNCGPGYFCAPTSYDEATGAELCEVCVPLGGPGARCQPSGPRPECQDGLVCIIDGPSGVCEAPRADGRPCNVSDECASEFCRMSVCASGGEAGAACDVGPDCRWPLTCIDGACAERRANGEPCSGSGDCATFVCHSDRLCGRPLGASCGSGDCRDGLYCDGTCRTPMAAGSSCSEDAACTSGWCDRTSRVCGPRPPPAGVGGACSTTDDCEAGLECMGTTCLLPCGDGCPAGQFCDSSASYTHCEPARADGASCRSDEDCLSGFCNSRDACQTRPGIGDPCSGFGECGFRAFCDGGTCVARRGPGEACSGFESCLQPYACLSGACELISLACEPAPVGQQCTYLRFCEDDAYCDPSTFRCAPRVGAGAACTIVGRDEDNCAPGLVCEYGPEGGSCVPRVAEGQPCTAASRCVEGAFCIDGTCQSGMGGNPCDTAADCALGLRCDRRMDVCLPPSGEGGPCDYGNGGCEPGLFCDTSDTCVRGGGLGASCGSFDGCDVGLACIGSTCVMRVGAGATCQTGFDDPLGSDCVEGTYCNDASVCVARLANGASCSSGQECVSGICSSDLYRCVANAECVLPAR